MIGPAKERNGRGPLIKNILSKEKTFKKCTCNDRAFNTLVLKSNLVVRVVHARIQILVQDLIPILVEKTRKRKYVQRNSIPS